MTGRYALKLGFQSGVLNMKARDTLPIAERTIAQELKAAGYKTGIFGKWHLGNFQYASVPNQRGFDSYRGYYGGTLQFFTKMNGGALDMHVDNKGDEDPDSIGESVVFNPPPTPSPQAHTYARTHARTHAHTHAYTFAHLPTCTCYNYLLQ